MSRATVLRALALLAGTADTVACAPDPIDDIRTSFIELRIGVVGGIAPALLRQRVLIGFDFNRCEFRAIVTAIRSGTETAVHTSYDVRTARVDEDEVVALLDDVLERGLTSLPSVEAPDGPDVFGRDTTLVFRHRGHSWSNPVAEGCWQPPGVVSAAALAIFDEIVERVQTVAARWADRPGSTLDEHAVAAHLVPGHQRLFLRAVDRLREDPVAPLLDLNRPWVAYGSALGFRWRWDQPLPADQHADRTRTQDAACIVVVREAGHDEVNARPIPPEARADRERRTAFVSAHPSLHAPARELVLAGWIEVGLSNEAVRAAWGPPLRQHAGEWTYERHGRSVTLLFEAGTLVRFD